MDNCKKALVIIFIKSLLVITVLWLTQPVHGNKAQHCFNSSNFLQMANVLKVSGWNMRSIFSCGTPYLHCWMEESDIICISEHGLYPCELYKLDRIHPDYISLAIASSMLSDNLGHKKGHGGCAVLWKTSLANRIRPLPYLSSDRMCVVQIDIDGRLVYVISVYLPHATCKVSDFKVEMSQLENLIDNCKTMGEVVVIGNMNVHFASEYGGRCWGSTSPNGKRLMSCLKSHDMCVVDIGEKGSGEGYTFASTNGMSYIDHCAVSNSLFSAVEQCNVLEDDIRNTSDHLAIKLSLNLKCLTIQSDWSHRQVVWHKLTPAEINDSYTQPLEIEISELLFAAGVNVDTIIQDPTSELLNSVEDLENITDVISKSILNCSSKLPIANYNKYLKPYWNDSLTSLSKEKSVYLSYGKMQKGLAMRPMKFISNIETLNVTSAGNKEDAQ